MHLQSLFAASIGIIALANAAPHPLTERCFDEDDLKDLFSPIASKFSSRARSVPDPTPVYDARRRKPPRDSGDAPLSSGVIGSQLSQISHARISAFSAASQAQAGATPAPNRIVCPGVIGAAPIPSKSNSDDAKLRVDPDAVMYLQGRASNPRRPKKSKHAATSTTQTVRRRAVDDVKSAQQPHPAYLPAKAKDDQDDRDDEDERDSECRDSNTGLAKRGGGDVDDDDDDNDDDDDGKRNIEQSAAPSGREIVARATRVDKSMAAVSVMEFAQALDDVQPTGVGNLNVSGNEPGDPQDQDWLVS